MSRGLLLVLALVTPLLLWRLNQPGFSDTEGMFAEPAREMVVTGDWITPRMNGEPFLTKPPLMYWLPAALFAAVGPTEHARLWPALAALATVAVTGALGTELLGAGAGLLGALVLATSLGFLKEARMLRADMVLVLTVTLSLYLYVRGRRTGRPVTLLAFWATMAVGILDKGLLAVLLPGGAIALAEALTGELRPRTLWRRLRVLRAPIGLAVMGVIIVPWHLLEGMRVPGFLWDYVVNQHLLFFFDEKLPRDSIPDTLGFFWTMFAVRTLPWSPLLPAAVLHAWRVAGADPRRRPGLILLAGWLAAVLGLFSLAASRLEHYALPALPAAALLVGVCLDDLATGRLRIARAWLTVPVVVVVLAALAACVRDPAALVATMDPTLARYALGTLARATAGTLAAGMLAVAALLVSGRGRATAWTGAALAAVLFVFVQLAHERVEELFSWRPFARLIAAQAPSARIFFRASDEYQLCGALEYYAGRRLDLLAPPGWVPPTFLEGRTAALFSDRAELARAWAAGGAVLVSDDVPATADEQPLVPGPFTVLGRAGERVLLRSRGG